MTRRSTTTRRRMRRRRLPTSPSYRPPAERSAALVERRVPQARQNPRVERTSWIEHRVAQARTHEPGERTSAEWVASIADGIRRAREAAETRQAPLPPPARAPVAVEPPSTPPEPWGAPAPEESRPRRLWWAALALALLVVLAAVGARVLGVWNWTDSPSRRALESAGSTATQGSGGTASLTTRIQVLPDRSLRVHQRIRSPEPMTSIVVAAPVDPYLTLGTVTASRLVVTAGGARVGGPGRVRLDSAAFGFDETRSVRLSYVLSGALQYADGSRRALARVTSLDLFTGHELRTLTYVFSGARVLNLACIPAGSNDPPQACGAQRGTEWVVRLDHAGSDLNRVMAQLDLLG